MNYVFEECPVLMLNKYILSPCMQPFQGPITILMLKRTILAGEVTRISHGGKTTMATHGQTTSNFPIIITVLPIINQITIKLLPIINPILSIINKTFLTMLHNLLSKVLHWRKE